MQLKFHWRLLQGGELFGHTRLTQNTMLEASLPDLAAQAEFCRDAAASGISSLLIDIGYAKPDPILLAAALATHSSDIRFMVAARSGLLSPALFVQQVNTLSQLSGGRVCLNIVAGYSPEEQRYYGDFLNHDERYARTAEFLEICHRLWDRAPVTLQGKYFSVEQARINTPFAAGAGNNNIEDRPEIFIGGNSDAARDLAIQHGSCWMRMADAPDVIEKSIAPVLARGKQAGLRLSIIAASTREEAVARGYEMVKSAAATAKHAQTEQRFVQSTDSQSIHSAWASAEKEWLSPYLWTGAVRTHGAPAVALVGSPEEIAAALIEYGLAGISQFILNGWPKQESMVYFGREVIPRVRALEKKLALRTVAGD